MATNEIIIDLKSEYKIKIEKVEKFEKSIFSDVYKAARANVLNIVSQKIEKNEIDAYNNVIAFTGERGKGKSSAMISFQKGLIEIKPGNKNDFFFCEFYDKPDNERVKYNFLSLDVIDPSLFRGGETLFEIVLAKMFSKFKSQIEEDDCCNKTKISDDDRRKLVGEFQKVFENLKYTKGNHKDDLFRQEALDALINLSSSSNLRESFQSLIKTYLRVLCNNNGENNFLIIAIDDFDLKIEGVYEMLEDVRQFLITQNVIVLIACKMEQLIQAVEFSILSHFKSTFKLNKSYFETYEIAPFHEIDSNEIKNKASKYVEKLFPISRQITLPNTQNINLNEILINTNSQNNDLKILEAIYVKKEIFFSSENYFKNVIYDYTLRSLINLLTSLQQKGHNQFFKYCEIHFSNYLNSGIAELLISCEYNVFNTSILKVISEDFYHHLNETQKHILTQLKDSSNYEIIQNSDVNSLLHVISKSININNPEINKIKAVCSIYNIRNVLYPSIIFESVRNKNISGIISPKLLDSRNRIPQNVFNRKNRDYFKVKKQINLDGFDNEQIIVISSFIQNLGEFDSYYNTNDENIFLNRLKRRGAPYQYYFFSIFTFINSPSNISKLYGRFRDDKLELDEIDEKWFNSKYFNLFTSPDFLLEFYDLLVETYRDLSKSGLIKAEKDEDLHSNLIVLFSKGIEQVFKRINAKYKFLFLDFPSYVEVNYVLKLFLKLEKDKTIKEFVNGSLDNYVYEKSFTGINSLFEIQFVHNVEPLKKIITLFETSEKLNRKALSDLIVDIDEQDTILKDFILEKNYFDSLFSNSKNKKDRVREDLLKNLKRLIENGQSEE